MVNFQFQSPHEDSLLSTVSDELPTIAENVARTARIAPTIAALGEGLRLVMRIDKKTGEHRLAIWADGPISREFHLAVWAAFAIPLDTPVRFSLDDDKPVVEWLWTVQEAAVPAWKQS